MRIPKKFRPEEKAQIEEMILKEYKKVLIEKPNSKISVNDLAEKAHIAKGTFYLFFSSKEALFLRTISEVYDEITFLIQEKTQQKRSSLDYFVEVLVGFSHIAEKNRWLVNASGKEFVLAQAQLTKEGKYYIAAKRKELWEQFLSPIKGEIQVSERRLMDSVSVLLLSNNYQEELLDFQSSYGYLAGLIGESILKVEDKNE